MPLAPAVETNSCPGLETDNCPCPGPEVLVKVGLVPFIIYHFHLFIGITLPYNERKEIIQSIIQDYRTILKRTVSYLSETQRPHSSCKFYKLVKDMF